MMHSRLLQRLAPANWDNTTPLAERVIYMSLQKTFADLPQTNEADYKDLAVSSLRTMATHMEQLAGALEIIGAPSLANTFQTFASHGRDMVEKIECEYERLQNEDYDAFAAADKEYDRAKVKRQIRELKDDLSVVAALMQVLLGRENPGELDDPGINALREQLRKILRSHNL